MSPCLGNFRSTDFHSLSLETAASLTMKAFILLFSILYNFITAASLPLSPRVKTSEAYDLGLDLKSRQSPSKDSLRILPGHSQHFIGGSDSEEWPTQFDIIIEVGERQGEHDKRLNEIEEEGMFII